MVRSLVWVKILLLLMSYGRSDAHLGCCEDHRPECNNWAQNGLCVSQQFAMAQNCPRACNMCVDEDLYDRDERCSAWLRQGACVLHRVKHKCPHSCGDCATPEPQLTYVKSITNPDFTCGVPYRQQGSFPSDLLRSANRGNQLGHSERSLIEGDVPDVTCGVTPISDRFLLTAAHCVTSSASSWTRIKLGEVSLSVRGGSSQLSTYDVKEIVYHPDYRPNSPERYNDIAIIQTVQPMQFSEKVYPLCVSTSRPGHGTRVTVQGFGLLADRSRPNHLREADLRIVGQAECEKAYEQEGSLTQLRYQYSRLLQGTDIICAGAPGRDACQGDSGGPMFAEDGNGRRFLVGIISGGKECGSVLPGTYVSIADHINFINTIMYPE